MSQLESASETSEPDEPATRRVSIDGGAATVSIPADASDREAAAVAVAIGAHLTDRQRAAAAAVAGSDTPRADPWRLVDRLDLERSDRWLDVEEGEEWRAASRRY